MTSVESKDCSVSHCISYFLIGLFSDISYFQLFASLVAQTVKCLPAMWETQVRALGGKDPQEGNGNPLQYYCLENSMDRGAR